MSSRVPPSLEALRNLGPRSCAWLREVGVETIEDLRALGPIGAYRLLHASGNRVSANLVWAVAGALIDRDWRDLPLRTKATLAREILQVQMELREAAGRS